MHRKATADLLSNGEGNLLQLAGPSGKLEISQRIRFDKVQVHSGFDAQELLASAHASCLAMSIAAKLNANGLHAEILEVRCFISFAANLITGSHVTVKARISGVDHQLFDFITKSAGANSVMSRVLDIPVSIQTELC